MKTYNPKKLIDGFKLGPQHGGFTYVAIPEQLVSPDGCIVFFNNRALRILKDQEPIKKETFKDKFRANKTYTLWYYVWEQKAETNVIKEKKVTNSNQISLL